MAQHLFSALLLNIKEKVSFVQVSYTKSIYNKNNIKEKVLVPSCIHPVYLGNSFFGSIKIIIYQKQYLGKSNFFGFHIPNQPKTY